MSLKKDIRRTHQSGSQLLATVEEIHYGYATVCIVEGGTRLTNLPVFGGEVVVGQRVIVDYGSGSPKVRPITQLSEEVTVPLAVAETHVEPVYFKGGDHSCRVRYSGGMVSVAHDTWQTVNFNTVEWDTDGFWSISNPERFTAVSPGLYLVIMRIGWNKTPVDRPLAYNETYGYWYLDVLAQKIEPFFIQVVHSSLGVLAMDSNYPIWSGEGYLVWDMNTLAPMATGDYVYVQVKHQNEAAEARSLVADPYGLYPRLQWQWMGFNG